MAFDYSKYELVADFIENTAHSGNLDEDAYVRICIHAIYYCAFHQLGGVHGFVTKENSPGKHIEATAYLRANGNRKKSKHLRRLLSLRVSADYDCLDENGTITPTTPMSIASELAQAKFYYDELLK